MKIFDKAVSNAYYMILNWSVLTFFAFLFQLTAIKLLTQQQFGIALTATNLSVFIGYMLTLGLSVAIAKLIPEYSKKNQVSRIKTVVSRSLIIILFVVSIFTILFIYNLDKISEILKIPKSALILTSISYFVLSFTLIFSSLVYGLQDMKRFFYGGLGYAVTKFVVSAVLIFLGFGYFGPIIGLLFGFLIWLVITFSPKYITTDINSVSDKELFKYGVPGLLNTFASSLFVNAQFVLLTVIKTATVTGIFGVGMLITSSILVIPNLLSLSVFPIISELSVDKKSKRSQKLLVDNTLRYSFFLTIPFIFILSIFSGFFILLLSKPEYLTVSVLIPILSISSLLFGISNILNNAIYATRKPKIFRNILIAVSLFFLLIMPFLASAKGDLGMALSYLFAMVFYLILSFTYLKKGLKIDFPLKDLSKLLIASLISFSPLIFLNAKINNPIIMLIAIAFSGIVYIVTLFLLKFYKSQDSRILKFFSKKMKISHPFIDYLINLFD